MNRTQRLQEVLVAASQHPVYHQRLQGLQLGAVAPGDLSTLPFSSRQDWTDYLSQNPQPPSQTRLIHLTPSPALGWMPEYLSQQDLAYQAHALAAHLRHFELAGKKAIVAFGYHVFAGGWLFHEALQQAGVSVLPHGPGEAERIAALSRQYGFEVLVSNPSFALRVAQAGGRFELLLAAGEPFSSVDGFRARVEEAIGGKAYDAFGTSEVGVVACEKPGPAGLYEIPEMAILEVIDPETLQRTPSGQKGELVITALSRTLMPMVRFRTGDLAQVEYPNGQLVLPRGVIGRTDLMAKVKGVKLYPLELGPVLLAYGLEGRSGFQVVVTRKDNGTDHLSLRLAGTTPPQGLAEALQRATGLRFDALESVAEISGSPLLDLR